MQFDYKHEFVEYVIVLDVHEEGVRVNCNADRIVRKLKKGIDLFRRE